MLLDWEYLSSDGWQPLTLVEDGTERFTRDGKISLAKFFGPDSKVDSVGGHSSNWIRGTVSSRTPHARVGVEPAGYFVRFTAAGAPAIKVGDAVHVDLQTVTSEVTAVLEGRLILATPLAGAVRGSVLKRGGTALGTVSSAPQWIASRSKAHATCCPATSSRSMAPLAPASCRPRNRRCT